MFSVNATSGIPVSQPGRRFEGPRYAMISDGAMTHLAHHRGQLTVYLRLLDQKVPAIYGLSSDEAY